MTLSSDKRKHFRSIGHGLHPVVTVASNGLSETVCNELERAIADHELIKVKLVIADRELRHQTASELCEQLNAELVQEIGKVVLIYRHNPKPNPKLSNVLRAGPAG